MVRVSTVLCTAALGVAPAAWAQAPSPALPAALQSPPPLASARPPPSACAIPDAGSRFPFPAGESLTYKLDVFGADVGTLDLWLERPAGDDKLHAVLVAKARTKTSAFLASAGAIYQAYATALLGKNLRPVRYREETDDASTHRSHELDFPAAGPMTQVLATKDGAPDPLGLPMSAEARDMLSAFLLIRAIALEPATQDTFCAELYAGRRLWKLTGGPRLRETIDTPLGKLATVRIDAVSTRLDDSKIVRKAQFWVTDDARRLPVVALGEFRGKFIRAQLVTVKGANRKPPPAPGP